MRSKRKVELQSRRIFSEGLRKEVVTKVESGEMRVLEACRIYDIKSSQTVYNWIYKYSRTLKKPTHTVVEQNSVDKKLKELKERTRELEAALGRKQMELDLHRNIIDLASSEYDVDLKKSFGEQASISRSNGKKRPK
jgi:transposase-like protein